MFLNWLRVAQRQGTSIFVLAAANYIFSSILFLSWCLLAKTGVHSESIIHGVIIGALYGSSFFLVLYCIGNLGLARTGTIINLALAIPVLASIIAWNEKPTSLVIIGLVAVTISIPMILLPRARQQPRINLVTISAAAVLFISQGLAYTVFKSFERLAMRPEKPVMLCALFLTAALITTVLLVIKRIKPDKRGIGNGIITGLFNSMAAAALAAALERAPATVVFPTITALTIVFSTLLGVVYWRERYGMVSLLGIALAVISVVLINL
jgi:drug/metabolite transporter (DMT)-like permease